ncbi:hypothetical protein ASPACDRAFT_1888314 [Aspergillus aculeatus ATCC 16872]|uniref:glucose oxidase n=1 Tax=Aspergillus aculeatus (strain ATCC 16872 / CBS 172.66 / WB 5094) TaxID=690307 RepID=A0A1L9WTS0_ASPA1|nr:uncharacterized protein ASPACDRAFT_1888314 [Aspergillus aculeatus ATCC 16872]OJJ99629.1 hypothetical protein ASPACDRAFT_1888314 [Aspergillus aculeatus ATCC 16872]
MFRPFVLLSALTAALASPIAHASQAEYDYIVIGGGTSGLVIANRLSENANVSVLVIEAGDSVLHNANVTAVDGYGLAFGTGIDWQYQTVNQTYGGKSQMVMRAGKALSGTSAINGMAYTRAEDVQIDAWQQIGNRGWTWDSLFPYYLQSENLTIPTRSQRLDGATFNTSYNGEQGPLTVGWGEIPTNNLTATINATFQGLGVPWSEDVNGGKMRGINIYPATINVAANVREDAARAYYWPVAARPNLHLLLNTFANRLIWQDEAPKGEAVTAAGVELTTANGTTTVVTARQEVIISAGSLKSPAILELSGIGNATLLHKHNISVQVDLPAVGENLQDQTNTHAEAATHATLAGTKYVVYPDIYDVYGNETAAVAASLRKKLDDYAHAAAAVSHGVITPAHLKELFEVQYDLIFTQRVPIAEILYYPGGSASISSESWTLLPFARGNVHIASADPAAMPAINPNFYMFDWDLDSQIAVSRYIRETFHAQPLQGLVEGVTVPPLEDDASDEEWKAWLLDGNYRSNFHPVGTAAMMPREKGGVVDPSLKVYGTRNVRVVDASVLPFQVCGHLTSTLYAVAERAAELIKQESALF